ncbi:SIMPL domain-containing protein [bacterium]|nr:SIMPL domain-containing protein [bacterium]
MNDARARAERIAQSTGQKVGSLKSASMGVVQVLAPNSTEVSDYGTHNISTIDKEVVVTVRVVFVLK